MFGSKNEQKNNIIDTQKRFCVPNIQNSEINLEEEEIKSNATNITERSELDRGKNALKSLDSEHTLSELKKNL